MRILHCCDTIAVGGGIASFVNNLSVAQSVSHDVSISVVSSQINENRLSFPEHINIIDFGKRTKGFSIRYPLKILGYLWKNRYNVVHIHSSFLYYFLAVLLLHNQMRFIYTVHSDAVKENSSVWDRRFWKLKRMCFQKGWIVPVTISQNSKNSFDALYQMNSTMIENGILKPELNSCGHKLEKFKLTDKTKLLLHVGRITEAKNQLMLCEAVSQLVALGADISLIIVGVNQDQVIFNKLQEYLGERIHYLGERTDINALLLEADAMCLSSIWEGLPIILLEALFASCVPICTPVGGISNVIKDGENGILASGVSVSEYVDAINRFLLLPNAEIQLMKENCKVTSAAYDITITSNKYIEIYR